MKKLLLGLVVTTALMVVGTTAPSYAAVMNPVPPKQHCQWVTVNGQTEYVCAMA